MSPARVRVVVVTYNSGQVLPAFLDSLTAAAAAAPEVVVVDNASPQGAPALPAGVRLIQAGGNLGYGSAANLGASGFDGEWLVIANPDIAWQAGSLDALLAAGDRWPDAGCLGPGIRTLDDKLYPSARAFPSLGRGLGHALCGWWWPANPWTRSYRAEVGRPVEGTTGWLSGSLMLVRRTAWEQIAGFDPKFFMYCEDMDLCRRLAEAGWQNVYVPAAVVTHVGGHATDGRSRVMLRAHHRSLFIYLSEHYPGPRAAPLRAALAVGLALRYLVASRVRSMGAGAAPTRSAQLLEDSP